MRRRWLASTVPLLAFPVWACDGGAVIVGFGPSRPSMASPFVASIEWVTSPAAPSFDIVISAAQPIDVDHMTIRMIEGSPPGGPMITVPRAELMQQFGTVHIAAGMTRTFRVTPGFVWTAPPRAIGTDVVCLDAHGVMHNVSAERPWP
jgi:hypothetical protein